MQSNKFVLPALIVCGVALGVGVDQLRKIPWCADTVTYAVDMENWASELMPIHRTSCDENCIGQNKNKSGETIVIGHSTSSWRTRKPFPVSSNLRYHIAMRYRVTANDLDLPVQTSLALIGVGSSGQIVEKQSPRIGNWRPRNGWTQWHDVIALDGKPYQKLSFGDGVTGAHLSISINILNSESQTEIESIAVIATEKSCGGNLVGRR